MTLFQLLSRTLLPSNPIDDISNNIISVQSFDVLFFLKEKWYQNALLTTTVVYELYLLAPKAC